MKHFLLVALVAVSFSSLANANNGVYASIKAGVSDTKYKNSVDTEYNSDDPDYVWIYSNNDQTKSIYPTISAALGYDFSAISPVNVRAELEYTYKSKTKYQPETYETYGDYAGVIGIDYEHYAAINTSSIKSQSLMLNGYYDFKNTSKFTPYLSAGVGFTHIKNTQTDTIHHTNASDSDNQFTWSAGIGVNYAISQNVGLDLSYRYVDAGKYDFTFTHTDGVIPTNTKFKLESNEYLLGIRYNF
jgi:opacity protein-like surface antigen